MNLFKSKKGSLNVSDKETNFKVRYLGNIQTAMMKGDGCVDKPVEILWNNYMRSSSTGLEMKLTVASCGLKAQTKEQGLTEYRAHRISYYIAHPLHPRLFVWVYRHEGRKMKVELRCHAVLCKSDVVSKVLAVQLHEKLSFALKEFLREKTRNQNTRLVLQRTNSIPKVGPAIPMRKQLKSTASSYKPPVSTSNKAPKLGSISEEDLQEEDIIEEEEEPDEVSITNSEGSDGTQNTMEMFMDSVPDNINLDEDIDVLSERILGCQMMLGNDIEVLKHDQKVQLRMQSSGSSESDEDSNSSKRRDSSTDDGDSLEGYEEQYSDMKSDTLNVNGIDVMITAF